MITPLNLVAPKQILRISLKGHFCSQIIFFLFLIPYLGIILRTPMFLECPISTSNLSKCAKMYLRQYWQNRLPILAKSPTCFVYNFINTGRRFGQYRFAIWPIRVGNLANTGWRFGVLELCLDMGSRKKKSILATEVSL